MGGYTLNIIKEEIRRMRKNAVLMTVLTISLVFALMPVAMPAVGAGDGACDWTGTWQTNPGEIVLSQAGTQVSGTVNFYGGRITGTLSGSTLIGTWSVAPSYTPPNEAGDFEFIISPDCTLITGKWRYGSTGDWKVGWNGSRVGPSKQASKQSVCASAKPSITSGSEFTTAEFTIGGTEPQKVRITQPAENFGIVNVYGGRYGGRVYQRIDGKSWGSLTLEPGTYRLSCGGGGAMGLESATVCIEYPVVTSTPPAPTTETKVGVSLPRREEVLATMPDGSKLMGMLPAIGPDDYSLSDPRRVEYMGGITVEVGKTRDYTMCTQFPDGHIEPSYWQRAEPGHLANVVSGGITPHGRDHRHEVWQRFAD
jgi:hypothetical protein